ncbi:hypothetical protein SAMN05421690_100119 [Nitrosomonas sp. Nm51]|uniref:hypothetical protein n=1 Tax=Nitrosomonas sp. Nm51 TaxID=133720 RepID=UPI0008BB8782|nr:hypothetical protein [Nitrosomonas sp. Nm51]SEQ74763.1 hypothetical protein SAMN05421690_100119 [Nitrosomonas sp. Nm51]
MSIEAVPDELPQECDAGAGKNSKGYKTSWTGYKLHIDAADGGIPISCVLTALKTGAIRKLMDAGSIQLTLFDERNLLEFVHPDFPEEKLVACRNPDLAYRYKHKREALLKATTEALEKVQAMAARGYLKDADKIGLRVGRVINRYRMAKHFNLEISEKQFNFSVNHEQVDEEAALDGIYVIRAARPGR